MADASVSAWGSCYNGWLICKTEQAKRRVLSHLFFQAQLTTSRSYVSTRLVILLALLSVVVTSFVVGQVTSYYFFLLA